MLASVKYVYTRISARISVNRVTKNVGEKCPVHSQNSKSNLTTRRRTNFLMNFNVRNNFPRPNQYTQNRLYIVQVFFSFFFFESPIFIIQIAVYRTTNCRKNRRQFCFVKEFSKLRERTRLKTDGDVCRTL